MNSTSPKSSFAKLGLNSKNKTLKVMVMGQSGVGKTAMIVRFITRRFIGEYLPEHEQTYVFSTVIDGEIVTFEIYDCAGVGEPLTNEEETPFELFTNWADAYIILYSVTDRCSFDECNRFKFLVDYLTRPKRKSSTKIFSFHETYRDIPIILVGNKTDLWNGRVISLEEGQNRFRELNCSSFHEISCRESADQVFNVFRDACRFWRVISKFPKLKRTASDFCQQSATDYLISPVSGIPMVEPSNLETAKPKSFLIMEPAWAEETTTSASATTSNEDIATGNEDAGSNSSHESKNEIALPPTPFRNRASTDGIIVRPQRSKLRGQPKPPICVFFNPNQRRMSMSTKGSEGSY